MKQIYTLKHLVFSLLLLVHAPLLAADDLTILFTHDLHSMFLPHRTLQNGQIRELGGYARLHTAILREKAKHPNNILLDAGDFSSGSFFYILFPSLSSELHLMHHMQYDATTLGNHEFDFGVSELAHALLAAKQRGYNIPILTANIHPRHPDLALLQHAFEQYGVAEYKVIQRNGLRIGVFGLLGPEAIQNAPAAEQVTFDNYLRAAEKTVHHLRQQQHVDIIICLSHAGTNPNPKHSEDHLLAAKVPGIDIIISGHTHSVFTKPAIVNRTIIVSAGAYAEYLGSITISTASTTNKTPTDSVSFRYALIPIDTTIDPHPSTAAIIQNYKEKLNTIYFDSLGRYIDDTVAFNPATIPAGSTVAKAMRSIPIPNSLGTKPIAVVPEGVIRAPILAGWLSENDIFGILSLGAGKDRMAGYPIVIVYLTGKELWDLCEIDASCAPIFPDAKLYFDGIKYTVNPHRLFCNRVIDVCIQTDANSFATPDNRTLYPVVGDLYSLQMLGAIRSLTWGILSITPKNAAGEPITDINNHIITLSNGLEYKQWIALSDYLRAMPDRCISTPLSAAANATVIHDKSIPALLSRPNTFAQIIYTAAIIIAAAAITFIILGFRRIIPKRKDSKENKLKQIKK
ncbi:MAG: bifunctional metallophosphatase/5'-nucleotidase [Prevotellaceae bacterium]|jgi:2',3'-cyclic-nucleotide 2'-phosphodiesterase (5'-nucleotidase family)|nr:bifunctional metallophosphatase/5'-nucleotidase [Prevotellaceae bacterium]